MADQFSCKVRGDLFARANLARSTEETRYWLNGVLIEPAQDGRPGAYLVATNGHIAVVIYDDTAEVSGRAIVNLPAALLKACKPAKRVPAPLLEIENGTASVGGLQASEVLIDGSFPDYRRIISDAADLDFEAGPVDVFNAVDVLTPLARALSPDSKVNALRIIGPKRADKDGWSPHLVHGEDPFAFGVAMPLRREAVAGLFGRQGAPGWFFPEVAAEKAA